MDLGGDVSASTWVINMAKCSDEVEPKNNEGNLS